MTWLYVVMGLAWMVLGASYARDGELLIGMLHALIGMLFMLLYVAYTLSGFQR